MGVKNLTLIDSDSEAIEIAKKVNKCWLKNVNLDIEINFINAHITKV